MENYIKYIINDSLTIIEALKALNDLSNDTLTLFVVDANGKMLGTLTDGDIRRALLRGNLLTDNIKYAMQTEFSYIHNGDKSIVSCIKSFRNKNFKLIPKLNDKFQILEIYNLKKSFSALPVDAVIMAGGKGERLRPLTEKIPKPLLKLGDRSIIDHNIQKLRTYGIRNIYITVNYLKEQVLEHFKNDDVKCIEEPDFLGTFGSVKLIDDFINDDVLIMNSDVFTNLNIEDFFLNYQDSNSSMSIAAVPHQVNIPYGIFEFENDEETIKKLYEKPSFNYYLNAGIYLVKRNLINYIPENSFFNADDFINFLIKNQYKVTKFPITGYWIDIGKHEDYKRAVEIVKHLNE